MARGGGAGADALERHGDGFAQADHIAVLQGRDAGDALAIDEGAVGGAEVFDGQGIAG